MGIQAEDFCGLKEKGRNDWNKLNDLKRNENESERNNMRSNGC